MLAVDKLTWIYAKISHGKSDPWNPVVDVDKDFTKLSLICLGEQMGNMRVSW